jgi:hypothetical protein
MKVRCAKDRAFCFATKETIIRVLGMEIVRHGRLIYERELELWLHHRAQLWHAYNDSLPFLRAARQRLREFAEEVRREMTADSRPQTAKKSGQDLHD